MELYISEFSKYAIALLIALYAFESFAVFRFHTEQKRSGVYLRQAIYMFLIHLCCFVVICFETGNIIYLIFYAFQQIILFAASNLFKMLYPTCNRLLVNNMCLMLSISFIILTRLSVDKAKKQFVIATIALFISLFVPFLVHKIKFLKNLKWLYSILGIGALGIVLILGQTTYGSKLSYSIAGITFQPSEFIKIVFVFFIAASLYKSSDFFDVFNSAVFAALHVIILVCSKDLGTASIFFITYVLMVFIATGKLLYLCIGFGGGAVAAYIAYTVFRHVQVRVQAFIDPWSVIDSAGYQITQSLFAISGGGLFGLGLYHGTPQSIPFVEADFIFSSIAEEMGLIFAVCLILICISSFIMFMNISMKMKDKFYQLVAFGLGITYIFQVFLTIGGGCKFIPLTGVTLPFISYGGSSMLTCVLMFAIGIGLSIIREEERELQKIKRKQRKKRKQLVATDISEEGDLPDEEWSEEQDEYDGYGNSISEEEF